MTKEYDRKVLLKREEFIALRSVLSDWYGDDRAELEIGVRAVPVQKLKNVADDILASMGGKENAAAMKIAAEYEKIVGSPLNKFTRFLSLKKHIMTIEVSHPAILRELNARLKSAIIAKVNAIAGPDMCREIKAVPSGQQLEK